MSFHHGAARTNEAHGVTQLFFSRTRMLVPRRVRKRIVMCIIAAGGIRFAYGHRCAHVACSISLSLSLSLSLDNHIALSIVLNLAVTTVVHM